MATIVLTGATGLIGSQLYKRLVQRGDAVIVFARNVEAAKQKFPDAKAIVKWSATEPSRAWESAINGADAVFNLAGSPVAVRWNDAVKKEITDSRVAGTRNIVAAIAKAANKPKVLINASAIGYYGNHPHDAKVEAFIETSPAGKDFLSGVCMAWEAEAMKAEALGIRVALIRTGIVLSTKEGALQKLLTPFKFFVGGPLGDGKQWFSWVHIDDDVNLFLYALDNSVQGPLNAVAPTSKQMDEFAETLGSVMSRPSAISVPRAALEALFGEAANIIAEGQKAFPKRAIESGFAFKYSELPAALKDILDNDK